MFIEVKSILKYILTGVLLIFIFSATKAKSESVWVKKSMENFDKYCSGQIFLFPDNNAFMAEEDHFLTKPGMVTRTDKGYRYFTGSYQYGSIFNSIYTPFFNFDFESPISELFGYDSGLEYFDNLYSFNSVFSNFLYKKELIDNIFDWLGTPYKWGGRSKRGVDCSNFTSLLLDETLGVDIPAGASYQATLFSKVRDFDDLVFGDLIFFTGSNWHSNRIGHVGIYLGNGAFAHASSYKKRGVIVSHISESKYKRRFRFGGRILDINGDRYSFL